MEKMIKKLLVPIIVFVLVFSLAGCAQAPVKEAAEAVVEAVGLKVTGLVNSEQGLGLTALKGMETKQVPSTNKAGETINYTGVPISKLLELAGLKDGTQTLVFVAGDGYSAEVPLADVQACADCIIGFQDDGTFINIMPGMAGKTQVKGLVEIQVK